MSETEIHSILARLSALDAYSKSFEGDPALFRACADDIRKLVIELWRARGPKEKAPEFPGAGTDSAAWRGSSER
jgi:hypothetical protein